MPRLRLCDECPRAPGAPAQWHDPAAWPHEPRFSRAPAAAIHDDNSFRRAYTHGSLQGIGRAFETRAEHKDYLLGHGLAEGAPDTPGPGPRAQMAQKAKVRFKEAFLRAKRKVW